MTRQLVVFRLNSSGYAFPLDVVSEVLLMVAIIPLLDQPPWIRGVIDVRGRVVPVVDLRSRLGMPAREPDLSTPILVAQVGGDAVGLVVDEVTDVVTASTECVSTGSAECGTVSEIVRLGKSLVTVLDAATLVAGTEGLIASSGTIGEQGR